MEIDFLKVYNGDAIHISYKYNDKDINIVIDSGTKGSYQEEDPLIPNEYKDGEFKKLIDKIKSNNQIINLLILTHVDDDHIGGVLSWFVSSEFDKSLIGEVWFNSGELINQYFKTNLENDNRQELTFEVFDSIKKSAIHHGVTFEEKILEYNIWYKQIIKRGIYIKKELGANFLVLSPSDKELKELLTKWEKKAPESLTTSTPREYTKTLKKLLENDDTKNPDRSEHNGSSIAFILEADGKKLLFLADCFHTTIVNSMKELNIDLLDVDLVKISHHGSKRNTSNKLLERIKCDKYVISTDGSRHKHPHKTTLARIIHKNPNCEIYLNYKEELLKKKLFLEQDEKDYIFSIYDTRDLKI